LFSFLGLSLAGVRASFTFCIFDLFSEKVFVFNEVSNNNIEQGLDGSFLSILSFIQTGHKPISRSKAITKRLLTFKPLPL